MRPLLVARGLLGDGYADSGGRVRGDSVGGSGDRNGVAGGLVTATAATDADSDDGRKEDDAKHCAPATAAGRNPKKEKHGQGGSASNCEELIQGAIQFSTVCARSDCERGGSGRRSRDADRGGYAAPYPVRRAGYGAGEGYAAGKSVGRSDGDRGSTGVGLLHGDRAAVRKSEGGSGWRCDGDGDGGSCCGHSR